MSGNTFPEPQPDSDSYDDAQLKPLLNIYKGQEKKALGKVGILLLIIRVGLVQQLPQFL